MDTSSEYERLRESLISRDEGHRVIQPRDLLCSYNDDFIKWCSLTTDIAKASCLRSLELCDVHISDDGIEALYHAYQGAPCQLEMISLANNSIGPQGALSLTKLISTSNNKIKRINLYKNHLSDEGAYHISMSFQHLKSLNIALNKIGHIGAKHIGEKLAHSKLESLQLTQNHIGSGAKHIFNGLINSNLHNLDISSNHITSSAIEEIVEIISTICQDKDMRKADTTIIPLSELIIAHNPFRPELAQELLDTWNIKSDLRLHIAKTTVPRDMSDDVSAKHEAAYLEKNRFISQPVTQPFPSKFARSYSSLTASNDLDTQKQLSSCLAHYKDEPIAQLLILSATSDPRIINDNILPELIHTILKRGVQTPALNIEPTFIPGHLTRFCTKANGVTAFPLSHWMLSVNKTPVSHPFIKALNCLLTWCSQKHNEFVKRSTQCMQALHNLHAMVYIRNAQMILSDLQKKPRSNQLKKLIVHSSEKIISTLLNLYQPLIRRLEETHKLEVITSSTPGYFDQHRLYRVEEERLTERTNTSTLLSSPITERIL